MESNTAINIGNRNQRIINVLLLNASFIDNLGLMHGKMGIAIYFFHLARETKNQIYEDYAGELIDEIYEEITTTTPLDFENGLAGIGWGIEYLVQNGFIEADTNEVLEDFDKRLQPSQEQFQGIGLLNGLTGLGAYYLKRVLKPASTDEEVPTLINKQMLAHLIDALELQIDSEGAINLIQGTKTFSLTWDYPVLIAFLTEVYQLNLFNFKVGRLLQQVIAPFFKPENICVQHSKRLLMVLALEKVKKCKIQQLQDVSLGRMIQNLLYGIDRNIIISELVINSPLLQNGTCGISWIYNQIYQLNGLEHLQTEAFWWKSRTLESNETHHGYAGFFVENEDKAFGLLMGLSGINLLMS